MAKGIGLIGNFKGKVGNMVGYKLSDSNTGNSQGIRVYQPIVRNPKTSAQAEQRAKLAPINATYRALKMVIDRGNEGLPYGNKSRLAWLKKAFKAQQMPWFEKGAVINHPVGCELTRGSLSSLGYSANSETFKLVANGVTSETTLNTIGAFSAALLSAYPQLKSGDQLTFVFIIASGSNLATQVFSIVLNPDSQVQLSGFSGDSNKILFEADDIIWGYALIVSREGDNGEHLRSTESLVIPDEYLEAAPYDATSKAAAIESYQNAASANADWAEESIQ